MEIWKKVKIFECKPLYYRMVKNKRRQMAKEQIMYMVRAGEGAYLIDEFLSRKVVAIGWAKVGDLSLLKDITAIKEKLKEVYPEAKTAQINNYAGQLSRFKSELKKGRSVTSYDPTERAYWIGEITSDYIFSPGEIESFPHWRTVEWTKKVLRDKLTTSTKNGLGSTLTIFKLSDTAAQEILDENKDIKNSGKSDALEADQTLETIKEDFEAKANDFIKDKLYKLDWDEMQDLVAGILRGMGYKTLVSPRGADRGKDIMASPDGLGLENPKIMVEVKHRTASMGSQEIRSFIGGLRPGDKAIYVSTGGFSKDAKYEAERSNIPLTLIDSDMLVSLIIQHYDKFDPDTRALIPLKKVYWPVDS